MRIEFEDKSYIDISQSNKPGYVYISIAAKSLDNERKLIVNSVELSVQQMLAMIKSVS